MDRVSSSEIHLIQAVFAYGTLKKGECRQNCWPVAPLAVLPATIRGCLWELGSYPGLTKGDDLVRGEVWCFERVQMPRVLAALDRVEGYGGSGQDIFERQAVEAKITAEQHLPVWVYFYARTLLGSARKILPDREGVVQWP